MALICSNQRCFLCFNSECLNTYDSLLITKIVKYLDLKLTTREAVYLCELCIESIETFHTFYERVKTLHGSKDWTESASELIKIELLEEDATKSVAHISEENDHEIKMTEGADKKELSSKLCSYSDSEKTYNSLDKTSSRRKCFKRKTPKSVPKLTIKLNTENDNGMVDSAITAQIKQVKKVRLNELVKYYENVTCPICLDKVTCSTLKNLSEHFQEHHQGQKSFIMCCDKKIELEDKNRLRRHLKIHYNPESCRCDVCGKNLATPRIMRIHKQLHIPEAERQFACEICGKKFGGNTELYRHKYCVHNEYYSVCQVCGKEFRKRASFQAHMKQVHEGAKKTYVCAVCGKTYRSYSNFHHHMNTLHTENYNYIPKTKQCSDCGKWVGAAYMKKHMVRHSGRSAYDCSMCDRVFKLPGDLRNHMVTHTNERPYSCSFCGAAFKTKATFKTHVGQHTGVNPVKCPYCGKMISNSSNYIAHRRRMHLKEHLDHLSSLSQNSTEIRSEVTLVGN